MIGVGLFLVGLALVVAGLVVLFGPWAAVGGGVVVMIVGLMWPEGATRAEPTATPPRR